MGFHVCEYCQDTTSSGDVTLHFANNHTYNIPDMILHYIAEHNYEPEADFVYDVLNNNIITGRYSTDAEEKKVGYLSGDDFKKWSDVNTKALFFLKLWTMLKKGNRRQTRSG